MTDEVAAEQGRAYADLKQTRHNIEEASSSLLKISDRLFNAGRTMDYLIRNLRGPKGDGLESQPEIAAAQASEIRDALTDFAPARVLALVSELEALVRKAHSLQCQVNQF